MTLRFSLILLTLGVQPAAVVGPLAAATGTESCCCCPVNQCNCGCETPASAGSAISLCDCFALPPVLPVSNSTTEFNQLRGAPPADLGEPVQLRADLASHLTAISYLWSHGPPDDVAHLATVILLT